MFALPGKVTQGIVLKRPSSSCKTPYVADVLISDENGTISNMAHTPALGCCGLCDQNATVLMTLVENKKNICNYRVDLSFYFEPKINDSIVIGTNPKIAEELVHNMLQQNALGFLKDIHSFQREKKIEGTNSRFDFVGIDANNIPFIMEVKNVPLADYVDCTSKDRKKMDPQKFDHVPYNHKIAYFPDGYRKQAKDTISPRALKHMNELADLCASKQYRTIMCYVIQREDVSSFQPSVIDPIYREAFYNARNKGVEMRAIQFKWDKNGHSQLICDDLTIN